jgi:hypothetical protein
MTAALPQSTRLPAGPLGLLLVLVALAMQMAMASVVPFAGAAAGVDRLIAASICHSDNGASDQGGTPAPHHSSDCAVCPLCQVVSHAGVLLAVPMAAIVGPVLLTIRAFALPPSRAPPGTGAFATSARGPPTAF